VNLNDAKKCETECMSCFNPLSVKLSAAGCEYLVVSNFAVVVDVTKGVYGCLFK